MVCLISILEQWKFFMQLKSFSTDYVLFLFKKFFELTVMCYIKLFLLNYQFS